MMRNILLFTWIVTCAVSSPLRAQAGANADDEDYAELALSDETAQVRYDTPTGIGGQEGSRVSYAVFLSEQRDVVGSAALLIGTDLQFAGLDIKFGPQAYAALLEAENEDAFAIAIGLEARYDILPSRNIAVVGSAFWSPDVLTFGSADNLRDYMARAEMGINERLTVFAGYRWFELDMLMRESRKLQDEIFAGVRWQLR